LHSGQVTSYIVLSASSVEFTCILDETVGTFTFGTVGLYLVDGTLFALSCLDTPRIKKSNNAGGEGDAIAIVARLNYTNLTTAFSFQQQTLAQANMLEVAGVHLLQPPAISPANAYITHTITGRNSQVMVTRMDDWLWDLVGWSRVGGAYRSGQSFIDGVVTAGTATSLTFPGVASFIKSFGAGDYIVQFVSGAFKGYCREVTSYTEDMLLWSATFPSSVTAGMQFILYRSTTALALDTSVDLSNYYTKDESDGRFKPINWNPDLSNYLTLQQGDARYQPAGAYGEVESHTFSNPGSYTLTVPADKTSMRVTLQGAGGGGGGGGGVITNSGYVGGGGGSGGFISTVISGLAPGAQYTLTVGAGGIGGIERNTNTVVPNANGTAGGDTSISGLVTATGGGGGKSANVFDNAAMGGAGGSAGSPAGAAGDVANANYPNGGSGASSRYGAGGAGGPGGGSQPTSDGAAGAVGAGGGGGGHNLGGSSPSHTGGRGGHGYAFIQFYDPNAMVSRSELDNLIAILTSHGVYP
jgi:hypothetical protein